MSGTPPIVLTFAATDPSGGAGLQADILTISSMGCHALSAVTAITVQDSAGVEDVLCLDAEWVADQARRVLEDVQVSVFKIGLLPSAEIVTVVAEILADYPDIPLILDPVLASGRGDPLVGENVIEAMCELLLPQTTILTPNSLEARRLVQEESEDSEYRSLAECARRLVELGSEYVLVTGTHENTHQVVNTLYDQSGAIQSDAWERLPGSYHGSGCTLAAALAAALANGIEVQDAVRDAQEFTWQSLRGAYRAGMGQLIPDRLFWARDDDAATAES